MFTTIINKILATFYHYLLAIERKIYRMYIADKQVFSNMGGGVILRGHIYSIVR